MKTMKNKMTMVLAAVAAAASLTMVACGKNNDTASTPLTNVSPFGGCVGSCPTAPVPVANATSSYGGYFQFNWQLFGDQQQVYAAQMAGGMYQGVISIAGTMMVQQQIQVGNCFLMPGQYTLQTVQGGMAQGSSISSLRVSATGPSGSFLMSFPGGASYLSTSQRMVGTLSIDQGTSFMGGIGGNMTCNDPFGGFLLN